MDKSLTEADWARAARSALLQGGVEAVRVERLARDLHVTKGSFYWHFRDREELLELLLKEWEEELSQQILPLLKGRKGKDALRSLLQLLVKRVPLGEHGIFPSDAAIFTWAAVSPDVARRVNRAEKQRIRLLKRVIGNSDVVELLYLVWLGFVAQGQRDPESRKRFPQIARIMLELSSVAGSRRKKTKLPR